MDKKDILGWLWDVQRHQNEGWDHIEDYPRYKRGPDKGHIIPVENNSNDWNGKNCSVATFRILKILVEI